MRTQTNLFRSKSGSSAVFLAVILAALISITLTMVFAGRNEVRISIADGALNLASASLLSEYDYYVQRDYGLFLIAGTDSQLSQNLRDYAGITSNASFASNASFTAKASSGRFSTVDTEPVRLQILDYMKSTGAAVMARDAAAGDAPGDTPSGVSGDTPGGAPDRTLRHGPTITSLPSRALPDSDIITTAGKLGENLTNPGAIFRTGTDKFLMTEYILQKFNRADSAQADDHFFSSEVEYILCGELSDEKNRRRTDLALEAVRSGLNLTHIYADPDKVSALASAAEVLTPGPAGVLTQFALAAAWAAAEAVNDVKLLHEGYKVPLVKSAVSWAVDLQSILEGASMEGGCIHPQVNTGRTYDDYLRILLYVKDENMKTARILDLIQINMRKNYDGSFLVQECATGVSVEAEVCGRSVAFDRIY